MGEGFEYLSVRLCVRVLWSEDGKLTSVGPISL